VVELGQLSTLLPCKPDNASRKVELAGQTVDMQMAGCEAAGTLFAISHLTGVDGTQAPALLHALRQGSLDNVRAREVHPSANSGNAQTSLDVLVEGQGPDGKPLKARYKWLLDGADIYQLAAYGAQLGPEQTDNLLNEAHLAASH
jgi:hypothetical protein